MTNPQSTLEALLATLQKSGPTSTAELLQRAVAALRPAAVGELLRRAALTRAFDKTLFDEVLRSGFERDPAVTFESFTNQPEICVVSRSSKTYTVNPQDRTRLQKTWADNPNEADGWNRRLADWFERNRPADIVSRIYYLVAVSKEDAQRLFEENFDAAESRFDLAACYSLIQGLKERDSLGESLSASLQLRVRAYRFRSYFADEYYRTATYFDRDEPFRTFQGVFENGGAWLVHPYATGGMGKTMFMRWLVARYLVPRRVWCARVDFDDIRFDAVKESPWLVLLAIAQQFAALEDSTYFSYLVERFDDELAWLQNPRLRQAAGRPAADRPFIDAPHAAQRRAEFLGSFGSALDQLPPDVPFVIIMDTLEELTLDGAAMVDLLDELKTLRKSKARPVVVLAGRYNIAERVPDLAPVLAAQAKSVPLRRFRPGEAAGYLKSRGIEDEGIIGAIIGKVYENASEGEPKEAAGCNPFTLRFFAEIVLGTPGFDEERVRLLPRRDFAYLLERVVLRITDQPLRWVIRYGAIPRLLNKGFVEAVLIPLLRQALDGTLPHDMPSENNPDEIANYLKAHGYDQDVWKPEPGRGVNADDLWQSLVRYASPDGWIALTADGTAARFHGDVVNPMRALLSRQLIFGLLQDRARQYFDGLAKAALEGPSPMDQKAVRWAEFQSDAVFHAFQKDGVNAVAYWQEALASETARQFPEARKRLAGEILRREYTDDGVTPYRSDDRPEPLVTEEALAQAHAATVEASIQISGETYASDSSEWKEIRRHMDAIDRLEKSLGHEVIRPATKARYMAAEQVQQRRLDDAVDTLRSALAQSTLPEDRVWLEAQLATSLSILRSDEAPLHYRQALKQLETANAAWVSPLDLRFGLADHYRSEGQVRAARQELLEALSDALQRGCQEDERRVQLSLIDLEFSSGSLDRADQILSAVESAGRPEDGCTVQWRRSRILLDAGWLTQAMAAAEEALHRAVEPDEKARCLHQRARVLAALQDYEGALRGFDEAGLAYRRLKQTIEFENTYIQQIELKVRSMGNAADALTMITAARSFRGQSDMAFYSRVRRAEMQANWLAGHEDEARAALSALMQPRDPEWPAELRVPTIATAMALGILPPENTTCGLLASLLGDVSPGMPRARSLAAFRLCDTPLPVPAFWRRKILGQLWRPKHGSLSYLSGSILLGEVNAALGERGAAVELMRPPLQTMDGPRFLIVRDALNGLRRAGAALTEQEASWWSALYQSTTALPTFRAAIAIDWARGVVATNHPFPTAELKASIDWLEKQPLVSRWLAYAHEVYGDWLRASDPEEANREYWRAGETWRKLGNHSREQQVADKSAIKAGPKITTEDTRGAGFQELHLSPGDLTAALADWLPEGSEAVRHESVEKLYRNWGKAVDEMRQLLLAGGARPEQRGYLLLRVAPGPVAAIPWELAPSGQVEGRLFYRGLSDGVPTYSESIRWMQATLRRLTGEPLAVDGIFGPKTSACLRKFQGMAGVAESGQPDVPSRKALYERLLKSGASTRGRILVLQPNMRATFTAETAYEMGGQSLAAEFYGGLDPVVLEDPHPLEIESAMEKVNPTVIHIVATVKDIQGGFIFLDFTRSAQEDRERLLGAAQLARLLHARPPGQPKPVIILDAATTFNPREDVRTIFLRNYYATELLHLDCASAVLGIGLGRHFEQAAVMNSVSQGLREGWPLSQVWRAIRKNWKPTGPGADGTIPCEAIAYLGSALFAEDPEMPIVLAGGPVTAS